MPQHRCCRRGVSGSGAGGVPRSAACQIVLVSSVYPCIASALLVCARKVADSTHSTRAVVSRAGPLQRPFVITGLHIPSVRINPPINNLEMAQAAVFPLCGCRAPGALHGQQCSRHQQQQPVQPVQPVRSGGLLPVSGGASGGGGTARRQRQHPHIRLLAAAAQSKDADNSSSSMVSDTSLPASSGSRQPRQRRKVGARREDHAFFIARSDLSYAQPWCFEQVTYWITHSRLRFHCLLEERHAEACPARLATCRGMRALLIASALPPTHPCPAERGAYGAAAAAAGRGGARRRRGCSTRATARHR